MQRIDLISVERTLQLKTVRKDFVWCSLALDKSTDNEDTAQLLIFIQDINKNFVITEELITWPKIIERYNHWSGLV